jgi:hypothetical protein
VSRNIVVGYDPQRPDPAPVAFAVVVDHERGAGIAFDFIAVESTSAARGLHTAAAENDAGLLVVSGARRSGVRAGAIAARLLHGAPCPVAVVPSSYAAAKLGRAGIARSKARCASMWSCCAEAFMNATLPSH